MFSLFSHAPIRLVKRRQAAWEIFSEYNFVLVWEKQSAIPGEKAVVKFS